MRSALAAAAIGASLLTALPASAHADATSDADTTGRLLVTLKLLTAIEKEPLGEAAELIGHDKKRAGSRVNFVFAKGLGDVVTIPLDLAELRELTRALA